jgi:hypothetical protein
MGYSPGSTHHTDRLLSVLGVEAIKEALESKRRSLEK